MTSSPTTVGGRYELGELLGRGGMAEVRRAVDQRLDPSLSSSCGPILPPTRRSKRGFAARLSRPPG